MDLNDCITKVQLLLEKNPLVILGSGASAAYGLPTMGNLAQKLIEHRDDFSQSDEAVIDFFTNISAGIDLETAMGMAYQLSAEDKKKIKMIVWDTINKSEKSFFINGLKNNFSGFSLVSLIQKIVAPTPHKADIITTNYDRLAEYAADLAGVSIVTGFEGSYIKKIEMPGNGLFSKRIKARERAVSIWKVHGSLDWFLSPSGQQCAIVGCSDVPTDYSPNIVAPGNDKYQVTHHDPYRSVMAQADNAIINAQCFLAIGYGFNDEHIQPKIIEEIKKGKPIVVVTKSATQACKDVLTQNHIQNYIIIDESDDRKTHIVTKDCEETYEEDFWSLQGFINKW